MPFIPPEKWKPVGVDSLEPAALDVVRSDRNTLVVAGPGAGKTELLSQRACFLLETRTCPPPYRILAISFKVDAAKNLAERVKKRCGDRAQQFDSYTLYAFAKRLVDRFSLALHEEWRPKPGYEVRLNSMKADEIRGWLHKAGISEETLYSKTNDQIQFCFDQLSHGQVLPYSDANLNPTIRGLGLRWWQEQLDCPEAQPSLSFPMLSRMAAFLLRTNPKLIRALRETYRYVFLDEFQDTTDAQYDMVRAAFQNSATVLTAVGDSKQRIMVYAGAMPDVFETYTSEFQAETHYLTSNYRSVPELVRIQHVIAQIVESETPPVTATKTDSGGGCTILEFSSSEDEANHLATLIEQSLNNGLKPRDFCILVRQKTTDMIGTLQDILKIRGIKLRDESKLQDLLTEPVVEFLIAIFRLATRPRDAEGWETLTNKVALLYGLDTDDDAVKIEQESQKLLQYAKDKFDGNIAINSLPAELVTIVGAARFCSVYRQYGNGEYLDKTVGLLALELQIAVGANDSAYKAIDDLIGVDAIPAITIHKSKGLEFHTVIFLGLEDDQFRNFSKQKDEEKRGFFVAFSRAIERVYFTFSDVRDGKFGRKTQQRTKINELYNILQQSGVITEDHRTQSI